MTQINLTEEHNNLIKSTGHALVLGGPGSGKTTISLVKASQNISDGLLESSQKILFLSFARATIARVEERAKQLLSPISLSQIEINTYHGFIWNILRAHGQLLCPGGQPTMLPPPEASALLAAIKGSDQRQAEKERLFWEERLLHFDQFAPVCGELLLRSNALTKILCDAYPVIVLDEFQDTNEPEWVLIKRLAEYSTLIALADIEQRIYEFRGADPARISQYIDFASPEQYDFGISNCRSAGTDILEYGNDLIGGSNKGKKYQNVEIFGYRIMKGVGRHLDLKTQLLNRRQSLIKSDVEDWSIAILVPTKKLMVEVSDFLSNEQPLANGRRLPAINHDVALETQGPSLSAKVISNLLDQSHLPAEAFSCLINGVCEYIKGRKGNSGPNQTELKFVEALMTALDNDTSVRGPKRKALWEDCQRIANQSSDLELIGDPAKDWLRVRHLFEISEIPELVELGADAKYLRLLHKGAVLRSRLSETWRANGSYINAMGIVQQALMQGHFASATKEWTGVHVMTMHKSKGKEFTETIIYEGSHYSGRIISKTGEKQEAQRRLLLRVAVTRAMRHVSILTPSTDPCPLL